MNDLSNLKKILTEEINSLRIKSKILKMNNVPRADTLIFLKNLDDFFNLLNQDFLDSNESNENDVLLTNKELEIAIHISNGFTNNEIASALSVSTKTIEFHVSSILKKTKTSNRTEAIAFLIRNKILENHS